jgi:hypothetical protein
MPTQRGVYQDWRRVQPLALALHPPVYHAIASLRACYTGPPS